MQASRIFNGIRFYAIRPGVWESGDKRYGLYRMMGNTAHEQWELYEGTGGDPLEGEMLTCNFTLGEVVRDWAKLTAAEAEQHCQRCGCEYEEGIEVHECPPGFTCGTIDVPQCMLDAFGLEEQT